MGLVFTSDMLSEQITEESGTDIPKQQSLSLRLPVSRRSVITASSRISQYSETRCPPGASNGGNGAHNGSNGESLMAIIVIQIIVTATRLRQRPTCYSNVCYVTVARLQYLPIVA